MAYYFKVTKPDDVKHETFKSAFYCAVTSIESVLYDYEIQIESDIPKIIITSENNKMPFSLSECKELIKGCFSDSDRITYQEFKIIEVSESE